MQKKLLLLAFLLIGCISVTQVGEAPIITTPKNISVLSGGQAQFKLVTGDATSTYTITANSVASKAAKFTIGDNSILMHLGDTKNIVLGSNTLFITLADIQDNTAILTLSTKLIPISKLANGASCTSSSQCQSSHCNNNFCCDTGTCCSITNNCPVGQRCVSNICITPGAQLCSDGTPYGNCSTNKPKYCSSDGSLINNCSMCGCPSGENCNSTSNICYTPQQPPAQPVYSPEEAEGLANSTDNGSLMLRFSSLFQTAKACSTATLAKRACLPTLGVSTTILNEGIYKTTYAYIFNSSCCSSSEVLRITTNLSTNSTSSEWVTPGIDSSLLNLINSSLMSNCAAAVTMLSCR